MCSDLDNCLKPRNIYTCSCLFDTLVLLKCFKIQCHEEIINKFNKILKQKIFSISLDHTINRAMNCVECLESFLFLVGTDCMHENIFFVDQSPLNATVELYCKKCVTKFLSRHKFVVNFW